jgi:hypothetical protein
MANCCLRVEFRLKPTDKTLLILTDRNRVNERFAMSIHTARQQSDRRWLPFFCLAMLLSAVITLQTSSAQAAELPADSDSSTNLPAPTLYSAEYEARAMGMSTDAYRRLESSADNQFILSHGLSVSVLGANLITVEESSEFSWHQSGAVPLNYQYIQTGVRRRDERVRFDWPQATANMTRDEREQHQNISKATLDNLSFSAQLSADLMYKPELRVPDTVLSYEILDARRLETHEYRVMGEERINTSAGELDTIKLERIRDSDSERSTLIWLSVDHQYTLAKLSQTEGGGSAMELSLKQFTWTDNTPAGSTGTTNTN